MKTLLPHVNPGHSYVPAQGYRAVDLSCTCGAGGSACLRPSDPDLRPSPMPATQRPQPADTTDPRRNGRRNRLPHSLSLALAILSALRLPAQTPVVTPPRVGVTGATTITLKEAIEKVLANDQTLVIARIDRGEASLNLTGAKGAFDPRAGFAAGRTRLLVATTVVEVGVDVPAATIMVWAMRRKSGQREAMPTRSPNAESGADIASAPMSTSLALPVRLSMMFDGLTSL